MRGMRNSQRIDEMLLETLIDGRFHFLHITHAIFDFIP